VGGAISIPHMASWIMLGFVPRLISAKSFLSILSEIITDQTFFGPAENPASLENDESVAYFSS
jgi:hypothetical protein